MSLVSSVGEVKCCGNLLWCAWCYWLSIDLWPRLWWTLRLAEIMTEIIHEQKQTLELHLLCVVNVCWDFQDVFSAYYYSLRQVLQVCSLCGERNSLTTWRTLLLSTTYFIIFMSATPMQTEEISAASYVMTSNKPFSPLYLFLYKNTDKWFEF